MWKESWTAWHAKSNPFKGKHLYNYLPVHIQSHFIVYRRRFVQNPELQAYWDNMPMIGNEPVRLKKLNPEEGWLAERWRPEQKDRAKAAPYRDYKGDKH